ncbi:MAG: hypothetical protein AB1646_02035 [Thermodesulfobacteriota bacterium]
MQLLLPMSRLLSSAYRSKPLTMVNRTNAVVYYLFFASHNETAPKIVGEIFKNHAKTGGY